jgi:hypothetical protein
MRWNRYVVDYNAGDQALFAMTLRRQSAALRSGLTTLWESWSLAMRRSLRIVWRHYWHAVLGLAVLVLAVVFVFRRTRPGEIAATWVLRARLRRTPVAFYERMLRTLARRGRPRAPEATAREFVASLCDAPLVQGPAFELTTLYERVRFGEQPLTPADGQRAVLLLRQLEAAPR